MNEILALVPEKERNALISPNGEINLLRAISKAKEADRPKIIAQLTPTDGAKSTPFGAMSDNSRDAVVSILTPELLRAMVLNGHDVQSDTCRKLAEQFVLNHPEFSAIDFLVMLRNAMRGDYQKDTFVLSSRRITIEFLEHWAKCYDEARRDAIEELEKTERKKRMDEEEKVAPEVVTALKDSLSRRAERQAKLDELSNAALKFDTHASASQQLARMAYVYCIPDTRVAEIVAYFMAIHDDTAKANAAAASYIRGRAANVHISDIARHFSASNEGKEALARQHAKAAEIGMAIATSQDLEKTAITLAEKHALVYANGGESEYPMSFQEAMKHFFVKKIAKNFDVTQS